MDDDGFTVQGSSRGAKARQAGRERNLETFYRDTPRYPGTEAEFTRAHARAYGIEEGLGPDGSHPGSVNPHFPKDSAREAAHLGYKASTDASNEAKGRYDRDHGVEGAEFAGMTEAEIEYYRAASNGLRPDQHARLAPHAARWEDTTYNMATGREKFLKQFPVGYHSRRQQHQHHMHAEEAYTQHGDASFACKRHEENRSYVSDVRRDIYNRPVPHGQR